MLIISIKYFFVTNIFQQWLKRQLFSKQKLKKAVEVYFSIFYPISRCLYFDNFSSHTRLRQLADFPSLILYCSYTVCIG